MADFEHHGYGDDRTTHIPMHGPPTDYLNQWIPTSSLEQMEQTQYDVIIVGSGAGGGTALWRLCDKWRKSGKRIAMLERGDLLLPTHAINLPTFNHERLMKYLENPKYKHPVPSQNTGGMPLDFVQFFAFGGRTIHWGTGSPRFHPLDFETWPIRYEDLAPYYRIAERIMGVTRDFTKGSYVQQMLLHRLHAIGYREAIDFPLAINHIFKKNGLHFSNVFSSINLMAHAMNVGSFDLAVNARVVQVLIEQATVAGIRVLAPDRRSYVIKGKSVVLSASTLENPLILLQSGIAGEATGRYLVNHSCVELQGDLGLHPTPRRLGHIAVLIPRTSHRLYQSEIHRQSPFGYSLDNDTAIAHDANPNDSIVIRGFGAVEPRFDNCVSLNPSQVDEDGIPKPRVQFMFGERDLRVIKHMTSSMQHQAGGIGMSMNTPPILKSPGKDSHESGTCRMGRNPYKSVTNEFGEVHGVRNLFMADSSVLPYIGATNPTLTIVALAVRTADYLLGRLGK